MSPRPVVPLGVSPISWTNNVIPEFGGDTPLRTCLSEAAKAGFEGIEFGIKFPRAAGELGPLLEEYGLKLVSGWYTGHLSEKTLQEELEQARRNAELLASLGSKVMVYGEAGSRPQRPSDQPMSSSPPLASIDVAAYCERINMLAETLEREFGLALSYHYHLMMIVETWEEIEWFFDGTDSAVGMLLDTGHAVASGVDLTKLLQRYSQRVNHIHLKDVRRNVLAQIRSENRSFNDGVRAGMFTVPGDGDIDFGPVAEFVRQSQYSGWLVVEAEQNPKKAPPFATVSRAAEYVSRVFS